MNARSPLDLDAFRQNVRSSLADNLPGDIRDRWIESSTVLFANRADTVRWQKILHERGWSVPTWPEEYGGPGWDVMQRYVFEIETALASAPPPPNAGPRMIGPVLMHYGTMEQKARFLPRIASADDYWRQGYSEPSSGSDLAALSLSTVRDGNDYVLEFEHGGNFLSGRIRTGLDRAKRAAAWSGVRNGTEEDCWR